MSTSTAPNPIVSPEPTRKPILIWLALFAMMLTSFSLVTSEFLPGGLLTVIAADLNVSAGAAAQMVTVTALVGFIVAPLIGVMTPGVDRRTLLVVLALGAVISNVVVAVAPSLWLLLVSRALLGAALSGFWSMSLTVAATIAGPARIGKAMMMVNAGTTLATVLGVPLGILLTSVMSWRATFVCVAIVTAVTAVALRFLLPRVPAEAGVKLKTLGETLRLPGVGQALAGHVLVIMGHFAAYALIRVAIERVPSIDAEGVASIILLFGVGGFIGNLVIGSFADKHLAVIKVIVPLLIAATIATLALVPPSAVVVSVATALWGVGFGGWLVVINTWASHEVPDRLEAAGGLIVAGFQLAITLGAAGAGFVVDTWGVVPALAIAAAVATVGLVLFATASTKRRRARSLATA